MSKRAKEKAELIANGIMINMQGRTGRVIYNTKEKSFDHHDLMSAARKGYEQSEKDTIERVVEWLKVHAKDYIVNMTGSYPDAPFDAIIGGKCWDELKKAMEEE